MSDEIFIPDATLQKLNEPAVKGSRHEQAKTIAFSLIGQGMAPQAVFAQLRAKYPDDVTDTELEKLVNWAQSKAPTPCGNEPGQPMRRFARPAIRPPEQPKRSPQEHAAWWLSGATLTLDRFKEQSQLPIPAARSEALILALEMLWHGDENLNILCTHIEEGGKAKPSGPGRIITRDKWVEYVREKGVPDSRAGGWIRPNPCKPQGSGSAGAVTDSDITRWRFLLLESDVLPLPQQLALLSKLKLPIAAVLMSGGVSAHAWVKLEAKTETEFSESARRILTALAPFGIDQANKNPSRLSRLPMAKRVIGAQGDGIQALLWLNPGRPALTTDGLKAFETSLEIPAIEEKPFRRTVSDAINRYEELVKNQGKTGIQTGFPQFDSDSGGLHPGTMSVIAGETNAGKSTVALNIVNNALKSGVGVALFTLEMSQDEIADLLFAMNADVDRNHFNTGYFQQGEIERMTTKAASLAKYPLWVYDDSTISATEIRKRILALKSESKIQLAVVDYAQIVLPEIGDNRELQVANIARTMRATAKDSGVALIVLSQLNDDGKLRESRVLGHEAHNVFQIENIEDREIKFKVVKGRRIQKKDYELDYYPRYSQLHAKATT